MIIIVLSIVISVVAFIIKITENEDDSINIEVKPNEHIIPLVLITTIFLTMLSKEVMETGMINVFLVQVLVLMSICDLRFKLVPDTLSAVVAIIGGIVILTDGELSGVLEHTISAMIVFIIFLGIAYLTNGGFGGADIKLFTALGLVFGASSTILIIVLTFVVGSIFVFVKFILTKDKEVKLVPYIAMATIITILYGYEIKYWYLDGGLNELILIR